MDKGDFVKKYDELKVSVTTFSPNDVITASGDDACKFSDISTWGNCFGQDSNFPGVDQIIDCCGKPETD